jgi:hypothetical protein
MTEKTKVIWDEAEMLKGAVVEKIGKSWMTLRSKDGKCYHVYAVCYQCGDGYFVIESEAPPQRG